MNDATSREQMMELVALYALGVEPFEDFVVERAVERQVGGELGLGARAARAQHVERAIARHA